MKISKYDKNLVAMSWLVEVFLNHMASLDYSKAPIDKHEDYDELCKNYEIMLDIVTDINQSFAKQLDQNFGEKFRSELVDITTMIAVIYQVLSPSELMEFFRWIGQSPQVGYKLKQISSNNEIVDSITDENNLSQSNNVEQQYEINNNNYNNIME